MKNYLRLFFSIALMVCTGFAFSRVLKIQPVGQFDSIEISTNSEMEVWDELLQNLEFTLIFDATPSNNYEISFGIDENLDGEITFLESQTTVGWDCGSWVMKSVTNRLEDVAEVQSGNKKLVFNLHLDDDGVPESLSVLDGDTPLFTDLTVVPSWLYNRDWDVMKLTARGLDRTNERFQISLSQDDHVILIR